MEYDNAGQIALWKNKTDNDKAPAAKGHFFAHRDIKAGEKIEVAMWKNPSDNENAPVMKGKVSDGQAAPTGGAAQTPSAEPFDDDDIPF